MQNINIRLIKVVAFTMLATLAICVLTRAAVSDYQARAEERQAILDEAKYYKTHSLVLNSCETDLDCERLDEMLEVNHTSYTLD